MRGRAHTLPLLTHLPLSAPSSHNRSELSTAIEWSPRTQAQPALRAPSTCHRHPSLPMPLASAPSYTCAYLHGTNRKCLAGRPVRRWRLTLHLHYDATLVAFEGPSQDLRTHFFPMSITSLNASRNARRRRRLTLRLRHLLRLRVPVSTRT